MIFYPNVYNIRWHGELAAFTKLPLWMCDLTYVCVFHTCRYWDRMFDVCVHPIILFFTSCVLKWTCKYLASAKHISFTMWIIDVIFFFPINNKTIISKEIFDLIGIYYYWRACYNRKLNSIWIGVRARSLLSLLNLTAYHPFVQFDKHGKTIVIEKSTDPKTQIKIF